MKRKKLDPKDLARCALTSLRLARIHQDFFSDALPDLKWMPADEKSAAKAASKISAHVSTLFPLWEMWDDEEFDMAITISEQIPISVFGYTYDEITDMAGTHPWHDLEMYLIFFDGFFGGRDAEEAGEQLSVEFNINERAPVWKVFLKLEMMLINGDERLQQHKVQWRNMARRLRYLTANTDHQFLDRSIEEQGYSGQIIPWEKKWVDALTEQWAEAKLYLDSTWEFVNWVKESPDNLDQAVEVVRMVCEAVAADEQMAAASLEDVRQGTSTGDAYMDLLKIQQLLTEMERNENDKPENEETTQAA